MVRNLSLLVCLLFSAINIAQIPRLSEDAQISVLTCGSGDELYATFGHTAFRVQDSVLGLDVVYNYGTFDFNRPNFYLNFAKGHMVYSLSRTRFANFLVEYETDKRWIKEQILNLSRAEKNQFLRFLENNYRPQNRDYLYDPLFDNCSNRVATILKNLFGEKIVFEDTHLDKRYTFRELIMQHLHWNTWSAFGINLAYGAVVDREATANEHMFLPYYAMYQLQNTLKDGKPLVLRERVILDYDEHGKRSFFLTSPLFWFGLLFMFVAAITYLDYRHDHKNPWIDITLFIISGAIGFFILFLWFFTNHSGTGNNLNVLWAMPLNLIVGFILLFSKRVPDWFTKYLWFALCALALLILVWIFSIQLFSPVIIPLMLALGVRYWFLLQWEKKR
ncbi:DUF4105 domain-containing protein [Allomuricauda sp. SCSIO 65647]|uniref:lipoprotein N-acyltransferase Lnb domain-containing protein n=1 Tax=Allomuricauda sp. SCSIO 65647 TaxID=2908843 RepID=UPI001F3D85D4|nr:DUF4105 domain-containing protein [Muricauda sp. SCSIO 65647]UJH66863.1 DUF4105 domain-containing protein [Muricauda sp. SCSIO 65647]